MVRQPSSRRCRNEQLAERQPFERKLPNHVRMSMQRDLRVAELPDHLQQLASGEMLSQRIAALQHTVRRSIRHLRGGHAKQIASEDSPFEHLVEPVMV